MTVAVVDVVRAVDEIPAMHVIYVAVAVLVNAIAGDLPGIDPQVSLKVGMRQVNAAVNYGNDDGLYAGLCAGDNVPCI